MNSAIGLADSEPQKIQGRWVFAGALGFDFRELTAAQAGRIAPFVVEAAWRRGMGPLLLIHGADRGIAGEMRAQWSAGEWMTWSYNRRSQRHGVTATQISLALRSHAVPSNAALPDFVPGCAAFDTPRCVGRPRTGRPGFGEATMPGAPCGSLAAPGRPVLRAA
jgi:hypothetical protein